MKFRFSVIVTEKDYLDFNKFYMTKSHYGKKQLLFARILMTIISIFLIIVSLVGNDFSSETLISIVPPLIILLAFQLGLPGFLMWILKGQMRHMKKTGKMAYSPSSVIEFFEDSFSETTEQGKTEHKYSAIERISIVNGRMIYIHVNNIMAYILPVAVFESNTQYWEFMDFIKTKNNNIEFY